MRETARRSKTPGIRIRIMCAVWELTKDSLLKCVTCEEIAVGLKKLGGKEMSARYVQTTIGQLQSPKLPYDTFHAEGFHSKNQGKGNTKKRYRLSGDTVTLPESAFILLELSNRGSNHLIPPDAVQDTINAASEYGLSQGDVVGRIGEAVRVGYLKRNIRNSFEVSDRLLREREYLEYLASKLESKSFPLSSPQATHAAAKKRGTIKGD